MFDERSGNAGEDPAVGWGDGLAVGRGDGPAVGCGDRPAVGGVGDTSPAAHVGRDWRQLDRQLRRLAARRAALDAEEAGALVAARDAELHRHLGLGSFGEYVERVLGYAPKTARERLRVAAALAELPALHAALAGGAVGFSAVRELTRVATPATEQAWLAAAAGKTVREIEDAVRGRRKGDGPGADPDPAIEPRLVNLELSPEAFALFVDARRHLEGAVGDVMSDSDFVATICRAVLVGKVPGVAADAGGDAVASNQPPHQIAYTVCRGCARGWHDVPGRSPAPAAPSAPTPAAPSAPAPASAPASAPAPAPAPVPALPAPASTAPRPMSEATPTDAEPRGDLVDAHRALIRLGYRPAEARAAVAAVAAHVGRPACLDELVVAALRACSRPRA